jgi:hypothetical protein
MKLILTPDEAELLGTVLDEYLMELRGEIADTDDYTYRMGLKEKQGALKGIVGRLATEAVEVLG